MYKHNILKNLIIGAAVALMSFSVVFAEKQYRQPTLAPIDDAAYSSDWENDTLNAPSRAAIYAELNAIEAAMLLHGIPIVQSDEIGFITTGSSFAPTVIAPNATFLWTFSDGTTATNGTPNKSFGSSATRQTRLKVTPWSAVTRINLGYDGADGGDNFETITGRAIEHATTQTVSAISHLDLVAQSLREFTYNYNALLATADFTGFANLTTVEFYGSTALADITFAGCTNLGRASFEANNPNLVEVDLTDCVNFQDVRGSVQHPFTITFPPEGSGREDVWHICIHDITDFGYNLPAMNTFPQLVDMFIWNLNQTGALNCSEMQHIGGLTLYNNHYTSADFTNSTVTSFNLNNNELATITLTGCTGLGTVNLNNNNFNTTEINNILAVLDTLGHTNGTADLRNNTAPGAEGLTSIDNLTGKGWTVNYDAPSTPTITTTTLPNGTQDVAYSQVVSATGGATPYAWDLYSGSLPTGLDFGASNGTIYGTPSVNGTYNFTARVTDAANLTDTQALSLLINAPAALEITTTSLADAINGTAYNQSISATGGATPYIWSVYSGALPGGVSLENTTGFVAGYPNETGIFNFTARVTDNNTNTDDQVLSILVNETSTAFNDNFNRANENPLAGNWAQATADENNIQLINNATSGYGAAHAWVYWNDTFNSDQYSQTVWAGGTFGAGPGVRINATAGCGVRFYSGNADLLHFPGLNSLGTFGSHTPANGEIIKLAVTGNIYTLTINGTQIGNNVTSTSLSGGSPGLFIYSSAAILDDFEGGNN